MDESRRTRRREFLKQVPGSLGVGALGGYLVGRAASRPPDNAAAGGGAEEGEAAGPRLGANASLRGKRVFPPDNPWNVDVSGMPVDPNSDTLLASIGLDKRLHPDFGTSYRGAPLGIPYVVVPGTQPRAVVTFEDGDESDDGYYPIPPDAPVEGGPGAKGDRHVLVIDRDNWKLYELYAASRAGKIWKADAGAVFDLNSNALRPAGWTSADAAGLPIFPGLARYDEVVERGVIPHALRFTCRRTRRAYLYPARHFASRVRDARLPPMGMRVRLKTGYGLRGFPPAAQVVLAALKKYGMMLADNGGDLFLSGAPHPRWPDKDLASLKRVKGSDFEVVWMGRLVTG